MKSIISFLSILLFTISWAQNVDSIQFKNISDQILVHGAAYKDLRELSLGIGNRLSGSDNYDKAVVWAQQKLEEAGADSVWLQEVMVPHWVRGEESLHIKSEKGNWKKIPMLSIGNSHGTDGKDLTAEILFVKDFEAFDKLSNEQVKGKFIFFNQAFDQRHVHTFKAYGECGQYRWSSADLVAKKDVAGVIIRSLASAFDDVPHTGSMRVGEKTVPAVAIGVNSADELEKMLKRQKVYAKLNSNCKMLDDKLSYSVIGEIKGKKDNDVIVVGGHLDTWDVGDGSHDDGAGIVQSIEVLRTFKTLGLENQHNIRVVLFANEENGARGGRKYAETAKESGENHLFALESDAGGFSPRGIALEMDAAKRKEIQSWSELFLPYGVYDFTMEHGGVDISFLKDQNVPLAGLVVDSQRYFDIHHTEEDSFDKVNRRELLLGAVTMTQLVYMIDKHW